MTNQLTIPKSLNLTKAETAALNALLSDLKQLCPLAKFRLFGSKVKGVADAESDLDLFIELPTPVPENLRRRIIHKVFEINLAYESNISVLIVSTEEWETGPLTLLPIHAAVVQDGVSI
ncbi:MAG: nucleotidyltransferase domain-containing protein [Desulfobacca sp.]|nr:nucleotidyltransferase domain-containing protein [Desulfobacca sp.]